MLLVSVWLYCIAALGAAVLGLRYLLGPVPAGYHAEILNRDRVEQPEGLRLVLTALYRVTGGAILGAALAICLLAFGLTPGAPLGVAMAPALVGLFMGLPGVLLPWNVEKATGVRTPWRLSAVLSGIVALAFLLSIL